MDFSLTEDQQIFQTMVRDFAANELQPMAAKVDQEEVFPWENMRKMAALGLFGVPVQEKYGGGGGDAIHVAIATEEIARACASTSAIYLASVSLAGYPLYTYGTEEQQRRFVTPMARGERLACFALTEPGAGSDAAGVQTTASLKGNHYVLDGNKIFITNGSEAHIAVVFATVDRAKRHKGIVALVVENDTPGFTLGKKEHKLGIRGSSTTELVFEGCKVPVENRLGGEGDGFKVAMSAIDSSRTAVAAQACGIAGGALDACLKYTKERQQFGQPISNFQAVQWMLADIATQVEAARLLTYKAAFLKNKGLPYVKEASMAKLFASETAMAVTTKAVQLHGGYGYTREYPVERFFRDAKITEIYEGTSEMQRMTIARQLVS